MAFNKAKVMEAARRAADKGQLDKAIREYLRVVREDPKDVRVWLTVGDLYAKRGAKQEAIDTYLKVARFYGEQGFHRKAIAVYRQVLKLDPNLIEVNLRLAELYREIGLYSEATQHFERVAAFFYRAGKTREALATIRQLLDLDPDNVATRIKLAELYSKEGSVESAVAEFRYALDFLREQSREDDFLKVGERVLWHQPDDIPLARELSATYLRQRDPRRALQKLQVCFKADARDVEVLAMLAQAFEQLEQVDKTVSVLKELARVLTEDGQYAQAGEVHQNILQYAPNDADSLAFVQASASGGDESAQEMELEPELDDTFESTDRLSADDLQVSQYGRATGAFPLVGDQHQPEAAIEQANSVEEPLSGFDFGDENDPGHQDGRVGGMGTASEEVHADEIIKILTESDVYVKYGLHQKAIDHLRQVFEFDPHNIEAREQLKEILLSQGREAEAVAELLHLARQTAASEPTAAEMYLRELLSIDARHHEAYELARDYQLRIADPDVAVIQETPGPAHIAGGGGDVVPVEDGDRPFDPRPGSALAGGSPAPGPNPNAPEVLDEADLILDDLSERAAGGNPNTGTQELELGDVEVAEVSGTREGSAPPALLGTDEDGLSPLPDLYPDADAPYEQAARALSPDLDESGKNIAAPHQLDRSRPAPHKERAPDPDDPDDTKNAVFIGDLGEFRAEPTPTSQEVPAADRVAAAPLDDPAALARELGESHPRGDLGDATSQVPVAPSPDRPGPEEYTEEIKGLAAQGGQVVETGETLSATPDPTQQHSLDPLDPAAGTSLEDDLDEAEFFLAQGLLDEAREILDALMVRYPDHPLVMAKIDDLAALGGAADDGGSAGDTADGEAGGERAESTATARSEPAAGAVHASSPQVMLERPVADEDADTHYDLGLAYKEMGLYDEAIKSFENVIGVRGVPCHLMIGLCHREQGKHTAAIAQFKKGLYVEGITEREKYSLYYEICTSYEHLQDASEALYYAEAVMKKDPTYRDVRDRVTRLRRLVADEMGGPSQGQDDTDAAIKQIAPRTRSH